MRDQLQILHTRPKTTLLKPTQTGCCCHRRQAHLNISSSLNHVVWFFTRFREAVAMSNMSCCSSCSLAEPFATAACNSSSRRTRQGMQHASVQTLFHTARTAARPIRHTLRVVTYQWHMCMALPVRLRLPHAATASKTTGSHMSQPTRADGTHSIRQ